MQFWVIFYSAFGATRDCGSSITDLLLFINYDGTVSFSHSAPRVKTFLDLLLEGALEKVSKLRFGFAFFGDRLPQGSTPIFNTELFNETCFMPIRNMSLFHSQASEFVAKIIERFTPVPGGFMDFAEDAFGSIYQIANTQFPKRRPYRHEARVVITITDNIGHHSLDVDGRLQGPNEWPGHHTCDPRYKYIPLEVIGKVLLEHHLTPMILTKDEHIPWWENTFQHLLHLEKDEGMWSVNSINNIYDEKEVVQGILAGLDALFCHLENRLEENLLPDDYTLSSTPATTRKISSRAFQSSASYTETSSIHFPNKEAHYEATTAFELEHSNIGTLSQTSSTMIFQSLKISTRTPKWYTTTSTIWHGKELSSETFWTASTELTTIDSVKEVWSTTLAKELTPLHVLQFWLVAPFIFTFLFAILCISHQKPNEIVAMSTFAVQPLESLSSRDQIATINTDNYI